MTDQARLDLAKEILERGMGTPGEVATYLNLSRISVSRLISQYAIPWKVAHDHFLQAQYSALLAERGLDKAMESAPRIEPRRGRRRLPPVRYIPAPGETPSRVLDPAEVTARYKK